jgi:hypothetical protein
MKRIFAVMDWRDISFLLAGLALGWATWFWLIEILRMLS